MAGKRKQDLVKAAIETCAEFLKAESDYMRKRKQFYRDVQRLVEAKTTMGVSIIIADVEAATLRLRAAQKESAAAENALLRHVRSEAGDICEREQGK
jgi:Zn-dependent peptidase ImmA (M78 family)